MRLKPHPCFSWSVWWLPVGPLLGLLGAFWVVSLPRCGPRGASWRSTVPVERATTHQLVPDAWVRKRCVYRDLVDRASHAADRYGMWAILRSHIASASADELLLLLEQGQSLQMESYAWLAEAVLCRLVHCSRDPKDAAELAVACSKATGEDVLSPVIEAWCANDPRAALGFIFGLGEDVGQLKLEGGKVALRSMADSDPQLLEQVILDGWSERSDKVVGTLLGDAFGLFLEKKAAVSINAADFARIAGLLNARQSNRLCIELSTLALSRGETQLALQLLMGMKPAEGYVSLSARQLGGQLAALGLPEDAFAGIPAGELRDALFSSLARTHVRAGELAIAESYLGGISSPYETQQLVRTLFKRSVELGDTDNALHFASMVDGKPFYEEGGGDSEFDARLHQLLRDNPDTRAELPAWLQTHLEYSEFKARLGGRMRIEFRF